MSYGLSDDAVLIRRCQQGDRTAFNDLVHRHEKRAYQYAAANWPWMGLMSLLTMPNADWLNDGNAQDEEQYWWAIMEPSQSPNTFWRPAFIELCIYFNSVQGGVCKWDPNK